MINDWIIQKIINSITAEPTLKINHLQGKSVSGFLFHARFTLRFKKKRCIDRFIQIYASPAITFFTYTSQSKINSSKSS
jgi:hypothetical protein